jgi:hypothetical protein
LAVWLSALLLAITCVLSTQMGHASPFQSFTSQYNSNGIKNFSIQWILTFEIILWKFKSPLGLQLPKWEPTLKCVGSFPHTFLHSCEHEMWLSGFIFDSHLCKPNARVVTKVHYLLVIHNFDLIFSLLESRLW